MNKHSTIFHYKNASIQIEGEAAKTINSILVVVLVCAFIAFVVKAFS